MRLIKVEFRKTITEAVRYYPDYIVGFVTDILFFCIILYTEGNQLEKLLSYTLWILVNGVIAEASVAISTEKQLGTLQNLMIQSYSIFQIITVKTAVWFGIHFLKAFLILLLGSIFIKTQIPLHLEYLFILFFVCLGSMGLSYLFSALTLVFTKTASFVNIFGYVLLFLSGAILPVSPRFSYTNPLSQGVRCLRALLKRQSMTKDFFILFLTCMMWLFVGGFLFTVVFKRSKQFRWTY